MDENERKNLDSEEVDIHLEKETLPKDDEKEIAFTSSEKINHLVGEPTKKPNVVPIISSIVAAVVVIAIILVVALGGLGNKNGDSFPEDNDSIGNNDNNQQGANNNSNNSNTDNNNSNSGNNNDNGGGTPNAPTTCNHSLGSWNTVKQATCKEDGKLVRTCSKCFETEESTVSKTDIHTEVIDEAVSATCISDGKSEGKHCSVCGKIIVAQTVVKASGHNEVVDPAVAATCSTTGLTIGKHCSICDTILLEQQELPKTMHEFSNGFCINCTAYDEIAKSAELLNEALRHKCAIEKIIDGHNWLIELNQGRIAELKTQYGISYVYDDATCYSNISEINSQISDLNYQISRLEMYNDPADRSKIANLKQQKSSLEKQKAKYEAMRSINDYENRILSYNDDYERNVSNENALYEQNKTNIELKYARDEKICSSHQWGDWKVLSEVSCEENGISTRYCNLCSLVDNIVDDKLGHSIVVDAYVAPTCVNSGSTEGSHCSTCNAILVAPQPISANGHNYNDWHRVVNPTCTAVGKDERTCSICSFKDYQTVDTLAHNYIDNWCTECDQVDPTAVFSILKNYIKSNGTQTSTGNYCLLLGTTEEEDFKYERKNYYNASTDTIKLAIDVYYFGQYQWTVSIEMTSVQPSYSWRWDDIGNGKMTGTFTASSFSGDLPYMPYTWTNIGSLVNDVKSMSVYYLDHLIWMMKEDYKPIGLQAKNFGFSKYK